MGFVRSRSFTKRGKTGCLFIAMTGTFGQKSGTVIVAGKVGYPSDWSPFPLELRSFKFIYGYVINRGFEGQNLKKLVF